MRTIIALILTLLMSTSMLGQNFDFEKDKQLHLYAGVTISSLAYEYNRYKRDGKNQFLVTVGSAAVAGIGKELYDEHKYNGFDIADAAYTTAGGVVTYLIAELTGINPGIIGISGLTGVYFTYQL